MPLLLLTTYVALDIFRVVIDVTARVN